jgi:hypothetical protein
VAATAKRVLAKTQPQYGGAFRSDPLRAPGAPQSHFAGEQLIDEIAYALKMDPRALRKQNIDGSTATSGARWLAALDAAGEESRLEGAPPHSGGSPDGRRPQRVAASRSGRSRAPRSGMVADIEVSLKTRKIVAKHLYIAHVNGFSMSPDLCSRTRTWAPRSRASRGRCTRGSRFSKERITSTDWVSYPILRIKDSHRP